MASCTAFDALVRHDHVIGTYIAAKACGRPRLTVRPWDYVEAHIYFRLTNDRCIVAGTHARLHFIIAACTAVNFRLHPFLAVN